MTTKLFFNVDYFRSLLIDDPEFFLNLIEKNGFEATLRNEVSHLIKEFETRISSAESKDRILLTAKTLDALGYPNEATEWIKSHFPNFEDRHEDILTAEQKLARDSGMQFCEKYLNLSHFLSIKDINTNRNQVEKISDICTMMNMHEQLVDVITDTLILNVGSNLEKPKEIQQNPMDTPILGLHEPPAADNNQNCSHDAIDNFWELDELDDLDEFDIFDDVDLTAGLDDIDLQVLREVAQLRDLE